MANQKEKCPCCRGSGNLSGDHATGMKMRAIRLKAKAPLEKVATYMGFTRQYIYDLEMGNNRWNQVLIQRYQNALK